MAFFTVELISQLKDRRIDLRVDTETQAQAAGYEAQLAAAPAWVRHGYHKARRALKQAARSCSDETAMRSQLIRNRILLPMHARGVTQAALAQRLHKSPAVLSRMLRSPDHCRLPTLERIANALNVNVSDLLA